MDNVAFIFDYWKDSEGECCGAVHDFLKKNTSVPVYVLVSHVHPDHFNREILSWPSLYHDVRLILSNDIYRYCRHSIGDFSAVFMKRTDVFSDANVRIQAFGSTDVGVSFAVNAGGLDFFHAGDLNNWLWRSSMKPGEARGAEHYFLQKLDDISAVHKHFNFVMFPFDPRLGDSLSRGGEQFISLIKVDTLIPMHSELLPGNYSIVNSFADKAKVYGSSFLQITGPGQQFNL